MTNASSAPAPGANGPLTGIRVIDLTSVVFGPYATQTLGDMGADVIKVEPPQGDIIRTVFPFRNAGMSGVFMSSNRNKRSMVLDLRKPEAKDALMRLIETADVFHSFHAPGRDNEAGSQLRGRRQGEPEHYLRISLGFSLNRAIRRSPGL